MVGSFLSAETLMNKNVLIENGIRSETKDITTSISEYSQGYIKRFDIISSSMSNGVHIINARVTVRITDFRAYIKKLSSDSKKLPTSIFAQIASEQSQEKNRIEILESYITKLASGEASEVIMSDPLRISELKEKSGYGRIIDFVDQNKTVIIPFKIKIRTSP